ncbi:MAG: T9SS type A sorting domain-containing protein [Bacteroidia bacterium]|nr:T9SS type A sorting domain-containing protein [Bacteroidia bacterium]
MNRIIVSIWISLLLLFGNTNCLMSQVSFFNQDNITITSGTVLTIKGDFYNKFTATIDNSGTIEISGNMTCISSNDVFGTSQGTVVLNGTVAQTIVGLTPITFNNLTLTNTGSKSLATNIVVGGSYVNPSGILSVGNSMLLLNNRTLTLTNPLPTGINYSTGVIVSESILNQSVLLWKMGSNTSSHTVPFGNLAGVQFPFTYFVVTGPANDVRMSTYGTTAANTPLPTTPVAVNHIRNNAGTDNSANMVNRYWHIESSANPVAEFLFSWPSSENPANGIVNPRGQNWNDPQISWNIPFAGQTNPTAQSVRVPGVTGLNHGTWTVALDASPLPVELLTFTAKPEENKRVRCDWVTASEINNDFFTIERSKDGVSFEPIGMVDGSGTTSAISEYYFYDQSPYSGVSYYRLKQTDFDGTQTWSNIIAVRLHGDNNINIYPTIVNDFINVESTSDSDLYFSLYSADGRLVMVYDLKSDKKSASAFQIQRGNIASGIYFARTTTLDGQTDTHKLIFQ